MFVLPELPYSVDALAPVLSAQTLRTHHGKHHAKYVETTNALVKDLKGEFATLEEVVLEAHRTKKQKLFNNAAQAWNHGFFWVSMTAGKTEPKGALAQAIDRDFGGLSALKEKFVAEGADHFASGWVWLVEEGGVLQVVSTHDADDTLVRPSLKPLLVCDLWEHAYYLDHKQDRKGFLEAWFDRLANWTFALEQLEGERWTYPAQVAEAA